MSHAAKSVSANAQPSASGFEIGSGPEQGVSVKLWGALGLGWFGRLATALARRGLSIQNATASRDGDETWLGKLDLSTLNATVDPQTLDYLALAEEEPLTPEDLQTAIERFRIERTETDAICLRLFAKDQVGLLSVLLERMQFLGLFPVRLRVTTSGAFVDDTLWLRGVAGHPPSAEAERALSDLLSRLRDPAAAEAW